MDSNMFDIKNFIPKKLNLPLRWWKYLLLKRLDAEMFWVIKNIKRSGFAIDVGSNLGFYSYSLGKKFNHVVSFEPLKELSIFLKQYNAKNIKIHDYALGNENGEVEIIIPFINSNEESSYAGIGAEDRYGNFKKRLIPIKKLDDNQYQGVDFIKIDVEGYEQEVLNGSYETILRSKPLLLIELEERHRKNSIFDTTNYLNEHFGYKGFFLENSHLVSIEKFKTEVHQKIDFNGNVIKPYINNFIFISQ
jgi:FkbM family methyltransferase